MLCKETIRCPRLPTQDVHIGFQIALQDMKVKEPLQASLKTQLSNSLARSESKGFPKKAYMSLIRLLYFRCMPMLCLHSHGKIRK